MMVRRRQDPICKFLPSHRTGVREVRIQFPPAQSHANSRTGLRECAQAVSLTSTILTFGVSGGRIGREPLEATNTCACAARLPLSRGEVDRRNARPHRG